ncbi:hypothetical protein V8E52_008979 [Russula decolorans]|jgi:hypothetical protein
MLSKQTWPTDNSPPHATASIHILDNDSLLNIFYLYRLAILGGEDSWINLEKEWADEKWWYKLAHVCQRWRNVILGSASYLRLCLVCTPGTPVADMLDHSPPLPLIIDCSEEDYDITAEDEEGIILSLEQRDRVRRIRLRLPVQALRKLIVAINEEYPILEYLSLESPKPGLGDKVLILPETLQAPYLRHLLLVGFSLPTGSRLLTTAVGLVTIRLAIDHPSAYILPNTLLRWISFMPQLETLMFGLLFPVINRDVERQLTRTPITTHATLPNLLTLVFGGASAYMEAVVRHITPPRLEKLEILFPNQLTFSIPSLLQFMNTTENLRFSSARFLFTEEQVDVEVYPHEEAKTYALFIMVDCWLLGWQVSSAAQIFNTLSQNFLAVEHLTFDYGVHTRSSEEHDEVDRTEWRKLLRSFSNVKTLSVDDGLVRELSCCLQLDDGELPLELLPELQELTFSRKSAFDNAFTQFIDARKNAGRPVTLTRR